MVSLFFSITSLALASLTATARSDQRTVEVGAEVRVEVRVSGTNLSNVIVTPPRAADGLEIGTGQGPAMQRSITVINGRQTQSESLVYVFEVSPTRAGTFTVPPFVVVNGAETTSTGTLTVQATGTFDPHQFAFVATRLDPRPRYVGEPIVVDVVTALGQQWVDRLVPGETSLNVPWVTEGLGNGALPEPEGSPAPNEAGSVQIRTPAGPVWMKPALESHGKDNWATRTLRRSFVPTRPGPVTIGPTGFRAVIATRVERDAIFGDRVFATETKLAAVEAPPVTVEVKPLPEIGRPDDFSGLVGRLKLDVEASPRQVKVGETVRVKLRVSGDGNVASTALPKVDVPGFKRFGAVEDVDASADTPSRTLTYDLAPATTEADTIPAFSISFFDTAAGAYRTLSSAPIHIKVLPGARVGAIEDTPAPSPTVEPHRDAAAEKPPDSREAAAPLVVAAWIAAATIPILLAGGWLAARRRRRTINSAPARRSVARRRLSAALRSLSSAPRDGAAGVALAMGRYLADLTERAPESFVGAELDAALGPFVADAGLRAEVAALVTEAEAVAFGGATGDVAAMAARAESLAPRIEESTRERSDPGGREAR